MFTFRSFLKLQLSYSKCFYLYEYTVSSQLSVGSYGGAAITNMLIMWLVHAIPKKMQIDTKMLLNYLYLNFIFFIVGLTYTFMFLHKNRLKVCIFGLKYVFICD